jgi:hypothetical protein
VTEFEGYDSKVERYILKSMENLFRKPLDNFVEIKKTSKTVKRKH